MPSLLDLPVELLDEIAAEAVAPRLCWGTQQARQQLDLRLVHPRLTHIFTRAIFQSSTIVLNPRTNRPVVQLAAFAKQCSVARYLRSLSVQAPNFLPTVHALNPAIPSLLATFTNLESLELALDGHYTSLADFPVLPKLRHLSMTGESFYSHLAVLRTATPNLTRLEIGSAAASGPPARAPAQLGNLYQTQGFAPTIHPVELSGEASQADFHAVDLEERSMPSSLTRLHISNVNTPSVQTLLLDLSFKPVHFTFTLIHNYDLAELVVLLCRDEFCSRTVSVHMVKSKLVMAQRLSDFKRQLHDGLSRSPIRVTWNDC